MSAALSVAVLVPVHDAAAFLGAALASVVGRPGVVEVVVVDDGSTDGSAELARRTPGVRAVSQPPRGVSAARNRALAESRAPVVGWVDGDDLWAAATPDPRLELLAARPEVDAVFGTVTVFRDRPAGRECLPPMPSWQLGAGLFRRALFARVGGFDESLVGGEDLEWFLRARDAGARIELLSDPVLLYRRHEGNMTRDEQRNRRFLTGALRRTVERRRGRDNR